MNGGGETWEIYNNHLNLINGSNSVVFLRSGTGFAFNNTATFASSYYSNTANMFVDNVRSGTKFGDNPSSGKCDGTSNWDGNILDNGWPCRDQIGRGKDTGTDESFIGKATSSEPAYFWNNYNLTGSKNIPVVVGSTSAQHILANRDYFDYTPSFNGTSGVGRGLLSARPSTCTTGVGYFATDAGSMGILYTCTSTNNWMKYYEPYTCPHPLTGLSGSCDANVAGTAGYNIDSSDTIAPASPTGLSVN